MVPKKTKKLTFFFVMELATSSEKLEHFQLTHLTRGWISMPLIHSDDPAFFFVYASWNVNIANMILSSILRENTIKKTKIRHS
jgi:hypothetical protein